MLLMRHMDEGEIEFDDGSELIIKKINGELYIVNEPYGDAEDVKLVFEEVDDEE